MIIPLVRSLLLSILLAAAPAHAQLPKIFVASFGNDANDGSRGAPKRNFQPAHDAVVAGGQIVVLDTAGYGALAITKSVSVTVPLGVNGFITATGNNNGITISAGSSGVVSLRGLIVEGGGAAAFGSGIFATSVGNLTFEDCTVRDFRRGIQFFPSNNAKLTIYNTAVRGCGFGIDVEVNGAFTTLASVNGCRLEQNNIGALRALTPLSTSSVDVSVADCVITANATGVFADGNSAASPVVRVSTSSITGNTTGVGASTGGQVLSRGNNTLEKNDSGNTFAGAYSAK